MPPRPSVTGHPENLPEHCPQRGILTTNFFSCFKWKLVHLRRYDSRRAAQADLFAYTTKIKKTAFHAPTRRAVPGCPSEGAAYIHLNNAEVRRDDLPAADVSIHVSSACRQKKFLSLLKKIKSPTIRMIKRFVGDSFQLGSQDSLRYPSPNNAF